MANSHRLSEVSVASVDTQKFFHDLKNIVCIYVNIASLIWRRPTAPQSSTSQTRDQQPLKQPEEQSAPSRSKQTAQQQQHPQTRQAGQQQQLPGANGSPISILPSQQQDQQRPQETQRRFPEESSSQTPAGSSRGPQNDGSPVAPIPENRSVDVHAEESNLPGSPSLTQMQETSWPSSSGQPKPSPKTRKHHLSFNFQESDSIGPQPNLVLYVGIVFGLVFLI